MKPKYAKLVSFIVTSGIVSTLCLVGGFMLVHSGIFLLILISPSYFVLENMGVIARPGPGDLAIYFVLQFLYHAVLVGAYKLIRAKLARGDTLNRPE